MQPGWGCSAILISLTPNHRAVRLQLKKCELYQISCQGVRMQMHTWCHEGLSLPLALSRPLFLYLCLCPSLSDELGDSLFCRKCSHHTDCRLVYSRFNLIIASPAFNQPASACFMLKPCCKHKTDFDARRPAKPSQRKKKKKKPPQRHGMRRRFCLLNIPSVYLLWQFASSPLEVREQICFPWDTKEPLESLPLPLPLVKTDTYLLAYTCGGTDLFPLKRTARIDTWRAARWMEQVCENCNVGISKGHEICRL